MNKNLIAASVIAVCLLLAGAWWLGWFGGNRYSDDPEVAELQRLRDEGMARDAERTEAEREAAREDFRQRMEGLTEQQRRDFFESSAPMFMKMASQRIDEFLAMPPEEQTRRMDERIDQMQASDGQPGGGRFGGGDSPPDAQQIDEFRKKMLDWTTPEQRAKFEQVMKMYARRMEERGVPPMPGGGFF